MKKPFFLIIILYGFVNQSFAQQIILDEKLEDWTDNELIINEPFDVFGIDFVELSIANDDDYLFLKLSFIHEILLQDDHDITLYLDVDNNPSTGLPFADIGYDMSFKFGKKSGSTYNGFPVPIFHNDIGLVTSPTVSSNEFEIMIKRDYNLNIPDLTGSIKLYISTGTSGYDVIPDENTAPVYEMKSNIPTAKDDFHIQRRFDEDFRILSYNVLRDNIFENNTFDAYENLLTAIDADIMCFQEIYDHTPAQLLDKLEDMRVIDRNQHDWQAVKDGNDLITVSKYPILNHREITGNSVVEISKDGLEMFVFNCHLPCCDNDAGRVEEIDAILALIREARLGNANINIPDNTPYIILGDMNFVGHASQVNSFITGDIINNFAFGDDVTMDYADGLMTDLIPRTSGFPASFTWYNPNGSFSAGRLDYIFYTDNVMEATNSFVLNTAGLSNSDLQDLMLTSVDNAIASDHYPLVADFKILRTSTQELAIKPIVKLYPNPAINDINIISDTAFASYWIYNSNGKLIKKSKDGKILQAVVPTWDLKPGVYFIQLQFEKKTLIRKLVIIQ